MRINARPLAAKGIPSCAGVGRAIIEGFRSGLAVLGYTEGKNIRVLYRFADGSADHLSALALELDSLGAIVIVMFQSPHGWALIQ